MAYRDASGAIMIDEIAANRDIGNIRTAVRDLDEAKTKLMDIINVSSGFSGKAAQAQVEKGQALLKEIEKVQRELDSAVSLISRTVQAYKKLDQSLKETINMS